MSNIETDAGAIAGFGIGTFLLIILWFLVFVLFLFFVQGGRAVIAVTIVVVASILTVILIFLPKEERVKERDIVIYDKIFWPRLALIVGVFIFLIVGAVISFLESMHPVHVKRVY